MYKSKTYSYDYDAYEEGKSAKTMMGDILADPGLPELEEIVIGSWGDSWESSVQIILDEMVANKEKFAHIKSLFVGDMDFEECEVSWIIQGDYQKVIESLPNLEKLTIKGSTDLSLGKVVHDKLESLEIICGGLPSEVIKSIQEAKLPSLKSLQLYLGEENYGFDGDADTIKELLEHSDFPKLEHLGICDSDIQDAVTEVVLDSKYMKQITSLALSMGTMTDKGGQLLLEKMPAFGNIKTLDLHYHFMSDKMMKDLEKLPMEVDVDEQNEPDEWNGEVYYYAMLTE